MNAAALKVRAKELAIQFLRYFASAGSALTAEWLTWSVLWLLTGMAIPAQAAAKLVGAVVGFWLYRRYVFPGSGSAARGQAVRFCIALAVSGILSVCIVALAGFYVPALVAKVIADGVTFSINYVVMKRYVFIQYKRHK